MNELSGRGKKEFRKLASLYVMLLRSKHQWLKNAKLILNAVCMTQWR